MKVRTSLGAAAVRVPGSTSNLGSGFDCVGLAIDHFLDVAFQPGAGGFTVERTDEARPGEALGEDLIATAFHRGLRAKGLEARGVVRVSSSIPVARGLGSSGAALVAGAALAALVAGERLDPAEAFAFATREEGHGDNAGASSYGGLVAAVGRIHALRAISLELSPAVGFAFAAPATRVPTRAARAALPASVPHAVAVGAVASAAALLRGLATGDADLLRRGFEDALHVPYRLPLIGGAEGALAAALEAGAWAGTVSGAGSGLLAVCPPEDAARIAESMARALAERHDSDGIISFPLRPVPLGVRELKIAPATAE